MNNKTNTFIEKAINKHGKTYDYSLVNYINNSIKIKIICSKHGVFEQTPKDHLRGCGCSKCYNERRRQIKNNINDFIEKSNIVHHNKYDYSKVEFKGSTMPITIICPKHGEFVQRPSNHIRGQGCPICANSNKGSYKRNNTNNFIKRASEKHKNKYVYSKVEYINNYTKVCIICPEHGEFWQKPNDHLRGVGCTLCGQKYNRTELEILEILKNKYKKVEYQHKEPFLASKTSYQLIDFFLPDYKIGIEYHGRQHFMPISKFGGQIEFEKTIERDLKKYEKCVKNNIKMFYLTYEKCDTSNYFTPIYKEINEMIKDIDKIIEK